MGKFVEFFGPSLANFSVLTRLTIANMASEYGATCGIFLIDGTTIDYMRLTGRDEARIVLVRGYALLGTMNQDITTASLGTRDDGKPVFLKNI